MVVLVALGSNAAIAAAKLWAAAVTGSSALASSGVHSLVDTSNQGLLAHGQTRAAAPSAASSSAEMRFWTLVVPILLYGMGAGITLSDGAARLIRPEPLLDAGVAYVVLLAGLVLQLLSVWSARADQKRQAASDPNLLAPRASGDPALAIVVLQNRAGLIGILLAFAGLVATDRYAIASADGLASLAIGVVLAYVAAAMALEVRAILRHDGDARPTTAPKKKKR